MHRLLVLSENSFARVFHVGSDVRHSAPGEGLDEHKGNRGGKMWKF
jgi:hypothetical protein